MNYLSTRKNGTNNEEKVSFKEAVINGLTKNSGLYFPETIPSLPSSFFENIENLEDNQIAFEVLKPFVKESLNEQQLKQIIKETLNFSIPVVQVENNIFSLELYHGATQAFKDVGARFMSRCLSYFYSKNENNQNVTILVATSGDTGSAVANGFFDVKGINVKILFPKGKVSPYQEFQMTTLGKNIQAIEVEGTFDDCQKLVKEAFNDTELREKITLSSANSINVARLLPQMLYYFLAYKQLKIQDVLGNKKLVVSVPSGNLGNISAGLIAKKIGLPIERFIAAHNANDTFYNYLQTGKYEQKASILTYSNAMDVGNPSNFERIEYLYNKDLEATKKDISAFTVDDISTIKEITNCYEKNNYLLDPHGAVGKLALHQSLKENEIGLFLETAHPQKFSEIIQKAIPNYESEKVDLSNAKKLFIKNSYDELVEIILK
ncbi:threonine synthase [Bernardetia litoralis DSM 6794]|uniref:Threonine synthase n=1 Tax=Bernardetia litoralis (strain ATCC 23117 / DSM 6794 / NBRC 15988 / NCIMB 1366 / Fx l1 / Sio-4) TaxID=880071 RepID=I4AGW4_BERLS|nr:threonine synthase [Bernardetia litoralis]AFM03199.1 threonine synthase [Bernardetia litoralis DSM 6794]